MEKPTYLYVIGAENGPVKIGITGNLTGRLSSIQTGCPFQAIIWFVKPIFSRDLAAEHEAMIHRVYQEKRLAGEWFDIDAAQGIEAIEVEIDTHHHFFVERAREEAEALLA